MKVRTIHTYKMILQQPNLCFGIPFGKIENGNRKTSKGGSNPLFSGDTETSGRGGLWPSKNPGSVPNPNKIPPKSFRWGKLSPTFIYNLLIRYLGLDKLIRWFKE